MKLISLIIFLLLTAIAAIHAYWAMGGLWPAASEQALIETVIGAPGMAAMPSAGLTLIVAGLIYAAGIVALSAGGVLSLAPHWLARIGAGGMGLIFASRGALGYSDVFAAPAMTEPFATLNFWYYSPLCLAIGGAFLALVFAARSSNREPTS